MRLVGLRDNLFYHFILSHVDVSLSSYSLCFAVTLAGEEPKMASFSDEINAYSYLYPVELPSKKFVFKWYAKYMHFISTFFLYLYLLYGQNTYYNDLGMFLTHSTISVICPMNELLVSIGD